MDCEARVAEADATAPRRLRTVSANPLLASRGRQCDGERIATQHHEGDQRPNRPLAVSVGTDELCHVADGCRLGLDLPAVGAQGGTFGIEVGPGAATRATVARGGSLNKRARKAI